MNNKINKINMFHDKEITILIYFSFYLLIFHRVQKSYYNFYILKQLKCTPNLMKLIKIKAKIYRYY